MISGVFNIYKEKGYTSQDVVAIVRGVLSKHYSRRIKAGHTGTLDPSACGVLPVCVGKATKIADYIMDGDKIYRAEIVFGITTDTEDIWGNITSRASFSFDQSSFEKALCSFTGEILQTPPMYSAIKVNGKKLYELAREGKTIARPARSVTIKSIRAAEEGAYEKIDGDLVYKTIIEIECSKGTYVRTLCKDIGEKLGVGACMGNLTRLRTGRFSVDSGINIEEFKALTLSDRILELLMPIDEALGLRKLFVMESASKRLYNGNSIDSSAVCDINGNRAEDLNILSKELILVHDHFSRCVGIYKYDTRKRAFTVKTMLLDGTVCDRGTDI